MARDSHAEAVGLDGGGDDPPLAERAGRVVRARRAAGRDRDRQGDGRVRGGDRRRIASILVPEGGSARIGEPIAKLDGDRPQAAPERARATPVARRRAVELGVSLHGLEGTGPAGGSPSTTSRPPPATSRRPRPARGSQGRGRRPTGRADADADDDRAADGARRRPSRRSRHVEIDMSTAASLRGRGELASRAPSVNDFLVRAAALTLRRVPPVQQLLGRRPRRALLPRQRRDRGRRRGRAARPDAVRRRPEAARADRRRVARPRRAGARAEADARRADGQHVHRLEPRHVRRPLLHGDRRPAAGRDPRGGRESDAEGRDRLRDADAPTTGVVYGADGAAFLQHLKSLLEQPAALVL